MSGIAGIDGLASGLPTQEIIDASIAAERTVAVQIEGRQELAEARLEALRTLNLRMLDADTELFQLRRSSTFNAKTTTVGDSGILSASATSVAGAGTYNLTVNQVAESQQLATAGQADRTSDLFTGDVTIGVGDSSFTFEFDEAVSLDELVRQINLQPDSGVTATIVNDPDTDPANPFRMVLTARETGVDNAIAITGSTLSGGSPDSDPFATLTEVRAAADAEVQLTVGAGPNAFTATASSGTNTIDDLIDGVTLNVTTTGSTTVTVGNDTAPAKAAITGYIESLNEALSYFDSNAGYDSDAGEAGILFNERGIRRSIEDVVRAMGSAAGDGAGQFKTLVAIGISYNESSGTFAIDEGALDGALNSDLEGVRDLFVAGGLGEAIDDQFNDLTRAADGELAARQDQIAQQIQSFQERIEKIDEQLEARRARLQAEFLNLEKITSEFQSIGSFLSGQIEAFANTAANIANRN